MPQETPDIDRAARDLAENVYVAFAQQASRPAHPLAEQTALTRLAEAIRAALPGGTPETVAEAINAVLDAWEVQEPGMRGPRVRSVDLASGAAVLRPD